MKVAEQRILTTTSACGSTFDALSLAAPGFAAIGEKFGFEFGTVRPAPNSTPTRHNGTLAHRLSSCSHLVCCMLIRCNFRSQSGFQTSSDAAGAFWKSRPWHASSTLPPLCQSAHEASEAMRRTLEIQSQAMQLTIETQGRQVTRLARAPAYRHVLHLVPHSRRLCNVSQQPGGPSQHLCRRVRGALCCRLEQAKIAFGGLTAIFSKQQPSDDPVLSCSEAPKASQVLAGHTQLAQGQAMVCDRGVRVGCSRYPLCNLRQVLRGGKFSARSPSQSAHFLTGSSPYALRGRDHALAISRNYSPRPSDHHASPHSAYSLEVSATFLNASSALLISYMSQM